MNYWIQRVGTAVLLLLAVSALTFGAMNLLGDPLVNILGPVASDTGNPMYADQIAAAKAQYHLDDPLPVRYLRWLGDFATGDMGVQFSAGGAPVNDLVVDRLPRTLVLLVMAQAMALVIAVPWALWAASNANRAVDRVSTVASFGMIAVPAFALGVILRWLLAFKWGVFPLTYNARDPFLTRLWQTVLPAFTIALPTAAVYQRLLRTDLITTLQEDFILMARSKGVSRRDLLLKHALRPSLFSLVTVFGINTGTLIGGSFIVESIFRVPGLGLTVLEAVLRDDFPVVLAVVMIVAAAFVLVNLLVDVLYAVIDPRVRA